MADHQSNAASHEAPPLSVNLQIISPSAGVPTLSFPSLPASMTVRQLRETIQEALPSRPADDRQRLIHRGRLLTSDTDTLHDVFGEDLVRLLPDGRINLVAF